jgi:hypothetical protein
MKVVKYFRIIVVILGFLFLILLTYFFVRYYSKSKFYSCISLELKDIIPSDSIGNPVDLICVGKYLILLDNHPIKGRGKIQVFDKRSLKFISSSGYYGSGPGELTSPIGLNNIPNDSTKFSIYDLALKRLTIYEIKNGEVKVNNMITLKHGLPYFPVVIDTLIFSLDFNLEDSRISVYNMEGNYIKSIGKLLPGLKKGVPARIHTHASQGRLRATPDGRFLVVVAVYSDIIDIYDREGNLIKRFHGPLNVTPIYNVVTNNGVPIMAVDIEKAIWGYINVSLTENFIYARFTGEKFKERADGKYIHVYDYNGKFLKCFKFDRNVFEAVFDPETRRFFTFQLYPQPLILAYEIPREK